MRRNINYYEYIGKKFNNLKIIDVIHKHDRYGYYFKCQCECGNEKTIRAINVFNGTIKSCGCRKHTYLRSDELLERIRQMGKRNRVHEEKCDYCGFDNHYAKGLCRNCYNRLKRNGYLEYCVEHRRGKDNDR